MMMWVRTEIEDTDLGDKGGGAVARLLGHGCRLGSSAMVGVWGSWDLGEKTGKEEEEFSRKKKKSWQWFE